MGGIAGAMFSGGVGEYVYGREERDFGDLGRRFGQAIRDRLAAGRLPFPLLPAGECIRATALGASEYSVQLSGNTVYLSSPGELLPRKNLQVLQPPVTLGDTIDPSEVAATIRTHFRDFDIVEGDSEVALAFRWRGAPAYPRLAGLARGILEALPRTLAAGKPLFVVLDGDVAHTLGALLKDEWGVASEVLVLDGIARGISTTRSRPRADALLHRSGDDQVARLQRGSARPGRARQSSGAHARARPRGR